MLDRADKGKGRRKGEQMSKTWKEIKGYEGHYLIERQQNQGMEKRKDDFS
jgi:hypothetical protein